MSEKSFSLFSPLKLSLPGFFSPKIDTPNTQEKCDFFNNCSFSIVDPILNTSGNYSDYVSEAISSICEIRKMGISAEAPQNRKKVEVAEKKKVVALDIDGTLLFADFEGRFKSQNVYDAYISFEKPLTSEEKKKLKLAQHIKKKKKILEKLFNKNYTKDADIIKDIKDSSENCENCETPKISVGVIFRPGLKEFLKNLSSSFLLCLFTASHLNYAKAVKDLLDPLGNIFFCVLARDECSNINNMVYVKDLSIHFSDLKTVVLVDNSMYSFMNNISNGILVNSFFGDKTDDALKNVLKYINERILKSEDVRKVNAKFFYFQEILDEIENEKK